MERVRWRELDGESLMERVGWRKLFLYLEQIKYLFKNNIFCMFQFFK